MGEAPLQFLITCEVASDIALAASALAELRHTRRLVRLPASDGPTQHKAQEGGRNSARRLVQGFYPARRLWKRGRPSGGARQPLRRGQRVREGQPRQPR
jgi:hypothetical protein